MVKHLAGDGTRDIPSEQGREWPTPFPADDPDAADMPWDAILHELHTPLTVALGRAQLLRRRLRRAGDGAPLDPGVARIEAALRDAPAPA